MAELIINKKIEFAYATENLSAELLSELEKRFLYQKILVVDSKYELSDEIDELIKKTKCDFLVVKDINDCNNLEVIACVIIVNCSDINHLKKFCTQVNKPYIIAVTKIYPTCFLNSQIIDNNKQIINCNNPLGVVLVKSKIYNKQEFICKFLLELVNLMFDNTQSKIDNLFFLNSQDLSVDKNFLDNLNFDLQLNNLQSFDKIAKSYLMLCIKKASKPLSLLDRVSELSCDFVIESKYKIETKFLIQSVLTSITKNFFKLWTKKLKSTINFQKHKKYLEKYNLNYEFNFCTINEQKTDFLLEQFRQKLINYTDDQLEYNLKIKNLIADINVDYLYNIYNVKFKNSLTDFICLEPDLYNQNSILKILSANGLLNFDF